MQDKKRATSYQLFVRARAPFPAPFGARWFTWSAEARTSLHELAVHVPNLPPPTLEYFEATEYGYSLTWDIGGLLRPTLSLRLQRIASAIYRFNNSSRLVLFDRLLDSEIDGNVLRCLFAFVRSHLVSQTGDELSAIYAPLGVVGGTEQKDFPLHADLYAPAFLLNVFDEVPGDGSGASLFLPVTVLRRCVGHLDCIPPKFKRRFEHLLTHPPASGYYEEFYDLLHGDHPWKDDLSRSMDLATLRIALERGQGYLVHDRRWLHGRDAPRGGVSRDRLHRLIFDTGRTRSARLAALRR